MQQESWKSRQFPQLSPQDKETLEKLLQIGLRLIEDVMSTEVMKEELQSVSYSQEIDSRTGKFRSAEAATSAIRARAFAEVVEILQKAVK